MKTTLYAIVAVLLLSAPAPAQSPGSCAEFQRLVKTIFNFKSPKQSASERDVKSDEMDKIWNEVKAVPKSLVPCLPTALEGPDKDPWCRFDSSFRGARAWQRSGESTGDLVLG